MAFFHQIPDIVVHLFLILLFLEPLPSCSIALPQNRRTTKKALDKFNRWTSNHQGESENSRMLWVDGNNVRGIGKFEWNAVELQHRVVRFCHKHKIQNAIVVWDHGSHQFASSTRYFFDDFGAPHAVSSTQMESCDEMFCVNLVVLFSGLRKRADDVLVKESNHLITSFKDGSKSNIELDWASLAFVTNDRDLTYKLRRQATPISPSIRLSRRKRRDNGKIHDFDIDRISIPSEEMNRKAVANPLFCDSTGFLDLLCELPGEYDMELNDIDTEASESIEKAKSSIRQCSKSQRRGYNPRREKTWERCVQAEIFRRFLDGDESSYAEKEQPPEVESLSKPANKNSVFIANYLQELESARGYVLPVQGKSNGGNTRNSDAVGVEFLPFLGPARLDKHQRRLLDRFNALVRNGEST